MGHPIIQDDINELSNINIHNIIKIYKYIFITFSIGYIAYYYIL